jgi:glycosyltransferase involved in cell wall biosynthesis
MNDVTIAIPVYNGAEYLAEAIDSALAQTHPADHVVVWDNASTDGSVDIARSRLPAEDVRTSSHNLGAAANFDRAVVGATTEWFMWLAADDRLDPRYVEECLAAAARAPRRPDAVLAGIRYIDGSGRPIRTQVDHDLGSPSLAVRARSFLRKSRWTESYCLYRRERLMESPRFTPEYGTDVLLTWWFILRGPLLVVDSLLLEYREASQRSVEEMARSLMVRDPHPYWRKARLYRRMWEMAGAPGLGRSPSWTARVELLRCLLSTSAALHLLEDIEIRAVALAADRDVAWRRSRLMAVALARHVVSSRQRLVVRRGDGRSEPTTGES